MATLYAAIGMGSAWAAAPGLPGTYVSVPDRIVAAPDLQADVERGLFFVPENRKDPGSRVIAVHFLRFPALGGAKGRPPVFLLAGGPGSDANFRNPRAGYSLRVVERLRRTRDVVYVSQRGNPKAPGLVPDLRQQFSTEPLDEVGSAIRWRNQERAALQEALRLWAARGVDLRGYDILNIVDDVYELRAALGYDRIVLRGCSFGSQWSLSYIKRWPQTVDRALLSGVEPLDYAYDSPKWLWASFARLAKRAEADPTLVNDIPEGGLMTALQSVIERLERRPETVTIEDPGSGNRISIVLGAEDVRRLLASRRVLGRTREERLGNWPRFVLEMQRGDLHYAAARTWESRTGREEREEQLLIFALIDNSLGITAKRDAQLRSEPETRWLGDLNSYYHDTRDIVPTPDVGDAFRADWQIPAPVLLVEGDLDWSTPIENARHLRRFLEHGHLIEVEGGTHCDENPVMAETRPQEMEQIYGFIDADFSRTTPEAYFAGLPKSVTYPPLRFSPMSDPSLYEQWLTAARKAGAP